MYRVRFTGLGTLFGEKSIEGREGRSGPKKPKQFRKSSVRNVSRARFHARRDGGQDR